MGQLIWILNAWQKASAAQHAHGNESGASDLEHTLVTGCKHTRTPWTKKLVVCRAQEALSYLKPTSCVWRCDDKSEQVASCSELYSRNSAKALRGKGFILGLTWAAVSSAKVVQRLFLKRLNVGLCGKGGSVWRFILRLRFRADLNGRLDIFQKRRTLCLEESAWWTRDMNLTFAEYQRG